MIEARGPVKDDKSPVFFCARDERISIKGCWKSTYDAYM